AERVRGPVRVTRAPRAHPPRLHNQLLARHGFEILVHNTSVPATASGRAPACGLPYLGFRAVVRPAWCAPVRSARSGPVAPPAPDPGALPDALGRLAAGRPAWHAHARSARLGPAARPWPWGQARPSAGAGDRAPARRPSAGQTTPATLVDADAVAFLLL